MDVAALEPRDGATLVGLAVRTVLVIIVFVISLVVAAETLDHAIRHTGYLTTFKNDDYFRSGAPSLAEAVWFFVLGPLLQVGAFGLLFVLVSRKRRALRARLRSVSWIMLAFDFALVLVLLGLSEAAIAI